MQFTKEFMEPFLLSQRTRAQEGPYTWAFRFLPTEGVWTEAVIHQVLRYLRDSPDSKESIRKETLYVNGVEGSSLLEVTGVPAIATYCLSEAPTTVAHRWFKRIVHASEMLPNELPLPILSQVIEELDTPAVDLGAWYDAPKNYRIVREFRYEVQDGITYVVRMVRESKDAFPTMKDSGVTVAPLGYEIWMECTDTPEIHTVLQHVVQVVQYITEQVSFLTQEEQQEVLSEYDALVSTVLQKPKYAKAGTVREEHHFLAPKPVTLEQVHLLEPSADTYGIVSVWQGYAVTDKADGERMLLYIAKNGCAYLINNVMDITDTGMRVKSSHLHGTLLDGELVHVHQRKDGSDRDLFAVFDIYFVEGKSVMDLPLIHKSGRNRYAAMQEVCDAKLWNTTKAHVDLRCKEHVAAEGDMMREVCKTLLMDAHKLPYDVDGLIFTPTELSVFGYYPGKPVPIPQNVRWDRVFKWKPAEQNTIDFLVEQGEEVFDPISKQRMREFKLYTGYNASQWEPITVKEGIRLRFDRGYSQQRFAGQELYRKKQFHPISHFEKGVGVALVPVQPNGQCICGDASVLEHQSIVEFAYDPSDPVEISKRWIPLRVRTDKTRIFQRTKHLSKTANDLSVATSIWRSIHSPVTKEMLMGTSHVPLSVIPATLEERLLGTDDVYYAREIPRQHLLSVHMLNFHNHGIKKMLYEYPQRKDALLELACGQAGDLPRWREGDYRFVMGVDYAKDNITNPSEGSYARMLKQRFAVKRLVQGVEKMVYTDMVFVVGDCAKQLANGEAAKGLDSESEEVLRILYNHKTAQEPYFDRLRGRAAKQFTVASCMFAIHYFFQSEDRLNGFLYNVSSNLRKNGVFLATFMDGNRVHTLLETSAKGVVEGRKMDGAVPVWALIQRYQGWSEEQGYFGKVVEVFLENTNHLIPEYLVNFELLVRKAKEYQLELVDTGMFSDTFAKLLAEAESKDAQRTKLHEDVLALKNDSVQTQFSFLNRWVIFKKTM
jgi:hypothetical protein